MWSFSRFQSYLPCSGLVCQRHCDPGSALFVLCLFIFPLPQLSPSCSQCLGDRRPSSPHLLFLTHFCFCLPPLQAGLFPYGNSLHFMGCPSPCHNWITASDLHIIILSVSHQQLVRFFHHLLISWHCRTW